MRKVKHKIATNEKENPANQAHMITKVRRKNQQQPKLDAKFELLLLPTLPCCCCTRCPWAARRVGQLVSLGDADSGRSDQSALHIKRRLISIRQLAAQTQSHHNFNRTFSQATILHIVGAKTTRQGWCCPVSAWVKVYGNHQKIPENKVKKYRAKVEEQRWLCLERSYVGEQSEKQERESQSQPIQLEGAKNTSQSKFPEVIP